MSFTWKIFNDTQILNGTLRTTSGPEEVGQRIIVTLQHHWQEYFLNIPAGVPWYDVILGSSDVKLVESILRQSVLDVPGVVSIVHFSSSFENRSYQVVMSVEVFVNNSTEVINLDQTLLV